VRLGHLVGPGHLVSRPFLDGNSVKFGDIRALHGHALPLWALLRAASPASWSPSNRNFRYSVLSEAVRELKPYPNSNSNSPHFKLYSSASSSQSRVFDCAKAKRNLYFTAVFGAILD
jgi:hypothetical protein